MFVRGRLRDDVAVARAAANLGVITVPLLVVAGLLARGAAGVTADVSLGFDPRASGRLKLSQALVAATGVWFPSPPGKTRRGASGASLPLARLKDCGVAMFASLLAGGVITWAGPVFWPHSLDYTAASWPAGVWNWIMLGAGLYALLHGVPTRERQPCRAQRAQ